MSGANHIHNHTSMASSSVNLLPFQLPLSNLAPGSSSQIDSSYPQSLINQYLASTYQSFLKHHHDKSSAFFPSPTNPLHVNGYRLFPNLPFFNPVVPTTSPITKQNPISQKEATNENDVIKQLNGMSNLDIEKSLIYQHRFFPLLKFMFEKVEEATRNPEVLSNNVITGAFQLNPTKTAQSEHRSSIDHVDVDREIGNFFLENQHLFTNQSRGESSNEAINKYNSNLDNLMANAILVLRIHLMELEKVNELCRDFAERYIEALKIKLNSDNIFKMDDDEDENGIEADADASENEGEKSTAKRKSNSGPKGSSKTKRKKSKSTTPNTPKKETCDSKYKILPETSLSSISLKVSAKTNASANERLFDSPSRPSLMTNESMSDDYEMVRKSEIRNDLDGSSSNDDDVFEDEDEEITIDDDENDEDSNAMAAGKSSSTDSKDPNKLKRGILPKSATNVMKKWLFQHLVHPYPSEEEKKQIATKTNLTLIQVNNWFINARRRILQPMLEASNPDLTKKKKSSQSSTTKPYQNNRYWPPSLSNVKVQPNSQHIHNSDQPQSNSANTSMSSSKSSSTGKSTTSCKSTENMNDEKSSPRISARPIPNQLEEGEVVTGNTTQQHFVFDGLDRTPRAYDSGKFLLENYHQHLLKSNLIPTPNSSTPIYNHFQPPISSFYFPPPFHFEPSMLIKNEFLSSHFPSPSLNQSAPAQEKKEKKPYSAFKIENLLDNSNNSKDKSKNSKIEGDQVQSNSQTSAAAFESASKLYFSYAQSPTFRNCFHQQQTFYQ